MAASRGGKPKPGPKAEPNPLVSYENALAYLRRKRSRLVKIHDATAPEAEFLRHAAKLFKDMRLHAGLQDDRFEILTRADEPPNPASPFTGINKHIEAVQHQLGLLWLWKLNSTLFPLGGGVGHLPPQPDLYSEAIGVLNRVKASITEARATIIASGERRVTGRGVPFLDAKQERAFVAAIVIRCRRFGVRLPDGKELAALAMLSELERLVMASTSSSSSADDETRRRADKWAKVLRRYVRDELADKKRKR